MVKLLCVPRIVAFLIEIVVHDDHDLVQLVAKAEDQKIVACSGSLMFWYLFAC